ncbi:hypothetical protein Tco_0648062 [Tanacetum coccineum]
MFKIYNLCTNLVDFVVMAPLPPRDQRHLWLHYQVEGYTKETMHDFQLRLKTIFGTMVRRIEDEMGLDAAGLHTAEEMAKDGFRAYWLGSERVIPDKGDLKIRFGGCLSSVKIGFWRLVVTRLNLRVYKVNFGVVAPLKRSIPLAARPRLKGVKSESRLFGGHFIRRLAHHFGLVSDDGLSGLSVMTREIPLIDMGELVKLNIYIEIGDNCVWVASGPERQPDAMAGAPGATDDAPVVDEGA